MKLCFKKWLEQGLGQNSMGMGDVSNNGLLKGRTKYKPVTKRSKKAEKLFGIKSGDKYK